MSAKNLKVLDVTMGDCQNWHHRYEDGRMACLACGVFDWKQRKWVGGYFEALKLIRREPRQKSVLDELSREDIKAILDD